MAEEKQPSHQPIDYGDHRYWDQRYTKTEGQRFEWLQPFENLQKQIEQALGNDKEKRILHLGCGNSALQDELYEAGYHRITNVDISGVVIEQMEKVKAAKGYSEMVFEVQDVRHMDYPAGSFDMVLDKSTIDSLMCTDNPITNVASMIDEAYRVLVPGGVYFILSYASPVTRLEHITRQHVNWEVERRQISRKNEEGDTLVHFLYVCRKLPLPQERTTEEWRQAYFAYLKELELKEYPPC